MIQRGPQLLRSSQSKARGVLPGPQLIRGSQSRARADPSLNVEGKPLVDGRRIAIS